MMNLIFHKTRLKYFTETICGKMRDHPDLKQIFERVFVSIDVYKELYRYKE